MSYAYPDARHTVQELITNHTMSDQFKKLVAGLPKGSEVLKLMDTYQVNVGGEVTTSFRSLLVNNTGKIKRIRHTVVYGLLQTWLADDVFVTLFTNEECQELTMKYLTRLMTKDQLALVLNPYKLLLLSKTLAMNVRGLCQVIRRMDADRTWHRARDSDPTQLALARMEAAKHLMARVIEAILEEAQTCAATGPFTLLDKFMDLAGLTRTEMLQWCPESEQELSYRRIASAWDSMVVHKELMEQIPCFPEEENSTTRPLISRLRQFFEVLIGFGPVSFVDITTAKPTKYIDLFEDRPEDSGYFLPDTRVMARVKRMLEVHAQVESAQWVLFTDTSDGVSVLSAPDENVCAVNVTITFDLARPVLALFMRFVYGSSWQNRLHDNVNYLMVIRMLKMLVTRQCADSIGGHAKKGGVGWPAVELQQAAHGLLSSVEMFGLDTQVEEDDLDGEGACINDFVALATAIQLSPVVEGAPVPEFTLITCLKDSDHQHHWQLPGHMNMRLQKFAEDDQIQTMQAVMWAPIYESRDQSLSNPLAGCRQPDRPIEMIFSKRGVWSSQDKQPIRVLNTTGCCTWQLRSRTARPDFGTLSWIHSRFHSNPFVNGFHPPASMCNIKRTNLIGAKNGSPEMRIFDSVEAMFSPSSRCQVMEVTLVHNPVHLTAFFDGLTATVHQERPHDPSHAWDANTSFEFGLHGCNSAKDIRRILCNGFRIGLEHDKVQGVAVPEHFVPTRRNKTHGNGIYTEQSMTGNQQIVFENGCNGNKRGFARLDVTGTDGHPMYVTLLVAHLTDNHTGRANSGQWNVEGYPAKLVVVGIVQLKDKWHTYPELYSQAHARYEKIRQDNPRVTSDMEPLGEVECSITSFFDTHLKDWFVNTTTTDYTAPKNPNGTSQGTRSNVWEVPTFLGTIVVDAKHKVLPPIVSEWYDQVYHQPLPEYTLAIELCSVWPGNPVKVDPGHSANLAEFMDVDPDRVDTVTAPAVDPMDTVDDLGNVTDNIADFDDMDHLPGGAMDSNALSTYPPQPASGPLLGLSALQSTLAARTKPRRSMQQRLPLKAPKPPDPNHKHIEENGRLYMNWRKLFEAWAECGRNYSQRVEEEINEDGTTTTRYIDIVPPRPSQKKREPARFRVNNFHMSTTIRANKAAKFPWSNTNAWGNRKHGAIAQRQRQHERWINYANEALRAKQEDDPNYKFQCLTKVPDYALSLEFIRMRDAGEGDYYLEPDPYNPTTPMDIPVTGCI